jgi:hypothetical protein
VLKCPKALPASHNIPNLPVADGLCTEAVLENGRWWMEFSRCRFMSAIKMLRSKLLKSVLEMAELNIVGVNAGRELLMVS